MLLDILISNGVLTVFLLVFVVTLLWLNIHRPSDLPPGPPIYFPGLGNLLEFNSRNLLTKLRDYRSQYGDVFSLKMGNKWWIVLNGYDAIHDALVKKADVFSSRPDIFLVRELAKYRGILFSSGHVWKEHRTFALTKLRDFGFGKRSIETNISEEVEVLLQYIEDQNVNAFDIYDNLHACLSNVTCSLLFGRRFKHSDANFLMILDTFQENMRLLNGAAVMTWLPILEYMPFDVFKIKKVKRNSRKLENFLEKIIEEHEESFDKNNIRDYIDSFLNERNQRIGDNGNTFTGHQLTRNILDLFAAGTETTSSALRWAIVYLIHNPEIQEKMRQEIYSIAGSSQVPKLHHRQNMPYTEAVLAEIQRCGEIVPLAIFHGIDTEAKLGGFRIPKDAIITPNLDSVLSDSKEFLEPYKFDPERFLDNDGKFRNREHSIPFSMGRRMCLGESLAKTEIFLFLTAMVQRFSFLPEGKVPPSTEPIIGSTRAPQRFKFRATSVLNKQLN